MALAALLFVKHLLADGPLQTSYQVRNKGKLLHPGGLLHSGVHAALSAVCFLIWFALLPAEFSTSAVATALLIALPAEYIAHYLIDLAKSRVDAKFAWSSPGAPGSDGSYLRVNSKLFFFAFLTDQMLHSFTYLGIIYFIAHSLH